MHAPILAYLILQEAAVVLLYILWQVGIEHKRGYLGVRKLCTILDFDVFSFHTLWWISLDNRQHYLVKL